MILYAEPSKKVTLFLAKNVHAVLGSAHCFEMRGSPRGIKAREKENRNAEFCLQRGDDIFKLRKVYSLAVQPARSGYILRPSNIRLVI